VHKKQAIYRLIKSPILFIDWPSNWDEDRNWALQKMAEQTWWYRQGAHHGGHVLDVKWYLASPNLVLTRYEYL